MSFQIIRNDITKVKADAIVNTANPKPIYNDGTDYAIYEAAGKNELLLARNKIGDIARGDAAETPAFGLNAKYIIHTVGPIWEGGTKGEFEILRSCYEKSLEIACRLKCRSIAFPLIAAGAHGFPKDKALEVAISVIRPFVEEHNMKVILVVFNREVFELSGKLVRNVREYVDSNYVDIATKREHRNSGQRRYLANYISKPVEPDGPAFRNEVCCTDTVIDLVEPGGSSRKKKRYVLESGFDNVTHNGTIDGLIASSEKTFQEKLFEIIDERGLTGPQVYKNYVSKQVFSKIQSNPEYHPNKFTAIALCLSLKLNLEQTQDLIGRAGWTLSPSKKMDLVIKGCILNKEFNIVNIDIILFDYHCPQLAKIK